MIGRRKNVLLVLALVSLLSGACRQDMQDQPKLEPLEESTFFDNGMASRIPPSGTVPRGHLRADSRLYMGKTEAGEFLKKPPIPVDLALLERGRDRYQIYCSVCHDSVGTGRGMIVRRGFNPPPSLHEARLVAMPAGYYFDVISNGFGAMSGYRRQVPVHDRWAIAAYLPVLQLSQNQTLESLPGEVQQAFHHAMEGQAAASHAGADDGHGGQQGHE